MTRLDPQVATHHLAIDPNLKPVKQMKRHFRSKLQDQIIAEVDKLITVGFIREVGYPTWLANIVHIRKKNGQIRVCVDLRGLNKACPKDGFLIPFTKMMINLMIRHRTLSFIDRSSGYNQIKMAPEDAVSYFI